MVSVICVIIPFSINKSANPDSIVKLESPDDKFDISTPLINPLTFRFALILTSPYTGFSFLN